MNRKIITLALVALILAPAVFTASCRAGSSAVATSGGTHDDMAALFREFREFAKPVMRDGIPDYTPAAIKAQYKGLQDYKRRLAAFDWESWPVPHRVDYLLFRAEMNGMEFDHKVIRPWSRDPGFYSVFSQFQPVRYGGMRLPQVPIPDDRIDDFRVQLQAVPGVLAQGRRNLTEPAGDLALCAIAFKESEIARLRGLRDRLAEHHPGLVADADAAIAAAEDYKTWLEANREKMPPHGGVGVDNYNWFIKNVYYMPYTWQELMAVCERELERSIAHMKLEEHRNRKLPPFKLMTPEEYIPFFNDSQRFLYDFLANEEIMTVPEWMTPRPITSFRAGSAPVLDYFAQVQVRDPLPLMPHDAVGHGPDMYRKTRDPRALRGGPYPPYHIEGVRMEALAVAAEELLMHAGLLDARPRSRELTYNLVAFRAARAIADLKMHSREMTYMDAFHYCVDATPYGWVPRAIEHSPTLWGDLDLYLRQPGYGMGYLIGSVQMFQLLADVAMQRGDGFTLKGFMDDFINCGIVPLALARWEMTGLDDQVKPFFTVEPLK